MGKRTYTRREFCDLASKGVAGAILLPMLPEDPVQARIKKVKDSEIRAGLDAAINKNLLPSAREMAYPGHFSICADGQGYGAENTWPGLDSWQMAGAYLLLGRTRMVLDYFEFVRASQRKDGNIPFAIFTGDTRPNDTYLRGMKYPEDAFTYKPPKREDLPASSQQTREWVGLFTHWSMAAQPLRPLGPVCYILTAAEIYDSTHSLPWLRDRMASVDAAAKYLNTLIGDNGLVNASGFYTELPPRFGYDGASQCYTIHAFREMARLCKAAGVKDKWSARADRLTKAFNEAFWSVDHYGEYIHHQRGLVDTHGLSDTNWAAVAFGIATGSHLQALWPRLMAEKGFWPGNLPTLTVTKPFTYESWEDDPVPWSVPSPTHDVACMGRAWFLEAMACKRMGAKERLVESARLVSRAAKDGYWRERYHPQKDGTVAPAGAETYCEYAAVLARVALGSKLF